MPKSNLGDPPFLDYALVADRIKLFYERYPAGRILTRLYSRTEREVTFVARVYRGINEPVAAIGWASEREGDGDINAVACLENTETSAVGRALANLGFTASTRRPSREEMEKASRARLRLAPRPSRVSEPQPLDADPLQQHANAVLDALALLDRVEAAGFPVARAETLRTALMKTDMAPSAVAQLEQRLRAWIATDRTPKP